MGIGDIWNWKKRKRKNGKGWKRSIIIEERINNLIIIRLDIVKSIIYIL